MSVLEMKFSDLTEAGEVLAHEYDPNYAREYYLKNRQLKGRKRGAAPVTSERPSGQGGGGGRREQRPQSPGAGPGRPAGGGKTEVEKAAEQRLVQLKARLDILRKELRRLVDEAQKRSGGDDPGKGSEKKQAETKSKDTAETKDSKEATSKDKGKDKPLTASQKQEKAKADKDRYDKANKNNRDVADDIQALQEKIEKIRARLAEATKRAREQATKSNKTAPNGR